MDIAYGVSAYIRNRGDFPELVLDNMVSEPTPVEARPSLQSRPGLSVSDDSYDVNGVDALYQVDGVFSNSLFAVSGGNLFKDGVSLGVLDGSGHVSIDGYETDIFVTAGESLWTYDGSTLSAVSFPNSSNVKKILVAASRVLAIEENTGRFYWTEPLGNTVSSLSFATAEKFPDHLIDMVWVGDSLYLFGSRTTEHWQLSGDSDTPFEPILGRVFRKGIRDTGCVAIVGDSFAWATDSNEICLDSPDNVISWPGLQARLRDSSSCKLWSFELDGQDFLSVRIDNETWVYSLGFNSWSTFSTNNQSNWIAQCFANNQFGSSIGGDVLVWSEDNKDIEEPVVREFSAWLPILEGTVNVANLFLRTIPGSTSFLEGEFDEPIVEMSWSDDRGKTYSSPQQASMGYQGDYRLDVNWYSIGFHSSPGILFKFTVSSPTDWRVSAVTLNGTYGGVV